MLAKRGSVKAGRMKSRGRVRGDSVMISPCVQNIFVCSVESSLTIKVANQKKDNDEKDNFCIGIFGSSVGA